MKTLFLLTSTVFAHCAAATSILLPLYLYPTDKAGWQPVFNAIASSQQQWTVIVNPQSGPGTGVSSGSDTAYMNAVAKLKGYPKVKVIGYVRTDYTKIPIETVKKDVDTYASWPANIKIEGIFFDEVPSKWQSTPDILTHYRALSSYAQTATGPTVVFNPGALGPPELFDSCTFMVEAENSVADYSKPGSDLAAGVSALSAIQKAKSAVFLYGASASTDVPGLLGMAKGEGLGAMFIDYGTCDTACYKQFDERNLDALAGAVGGSSNGTMSETGRYKQTSG